MGEREQKGATKRRHDWISGDCYHVPQGYCYLKRYRCRNCGEDHRCAMYLPPRIENALCKGRSEPEEAK